ncbi:MAG: DUF3781 domain-containing protein [Oscillospiraceae bacterium]
MDNSEILQSNLNRLHTTPLGVERIRKNLKIGDVDVVEFCRKIISDKSCKIRKTGKNWYCEAEGVVITVNSFSYTIITAKQICVKERKCAT